MTKSEIIISYAKQHEFFYPSELMQLLGSNLQSANGMCNYLKGTGVLLKSIDTRTKWRTNLPRYSLNPDYAPAEQKQPAKTAADVALLNQILNISLPEGKATIYRLGDRPEPQGKPKKLISRGIPSCMGMMDIG